MKKALTFTAVLLLTALVATAAFARPVDNGVRPQKEMLGDANRLQQAAMTSLKAAVANTTWFGNTEWNLAQSRWQAVAAVNNRNNRWTFDSGVDGNLEGWWGFDITKIPVPTKPVSPFGTPDNSDFRYTNKTLYDQYGDVSGSPAHELFPRTGDVGAIWCSKYEVEAQELCYLGGQGYGNGWGHEAHRDFTYGTSGDVKLTFKYFQNSEKTYDFTYLYLEFNGAREAAPRMVVSIGNFGSPAAPLQKIITVPAATIPGGTTTIRAVFRFTSDSGWCDEDGIFSTPYGPFCCYNFKYEDLTHTGNNHECTWEGGDADGWAFVQPDGYGAFTGIRDLADLPPPETSCPCIGPVLQGNVLVQYDQSAGPGDPPHPDGQDAMAMSPYIDLDAVSAGNLPVKMIVGDSYQAMPLNNAVFYKPWLRAYPVLCTVTGLSTEQFVAPDPFITYTPTPTCWDEIVWEDFRTVAPDIDYCYVALEVLSLCSVSTECTGAAGGNTTPWWDNLTLLCTGTAGTVAVASTEIRPFLQDIFAADGSLRPSSTCILDNSGDANFGTSASDADLEDTMYVTAGWIPNNGGVQINLFFRYTKGPGTQTAGVPFFTRYPTEGTWYSAQCDSGRGGIPVVEAKNTWCSEYIESSPYFTGEGQESNEILPDYVFTPGSKLDYYWSANFANTPASKFYWPDVTTGQIPLSVNLLPGMFVSGPDTLWPCTLYINGDSRQPLTNLSAFNQIEPALNIALGGTAGGTRLFDRYDDVLIGSNTNASFARQNTGENGMSATQALGYRTIVGAYGYSETYTVSEEDGNLLAFWLSTTSGGANDNRQVLYFSGDGLAADMSSSLKPVAGSLLNNYFGASLVCLPYHESNCPTGTIADTTFCAQLKAAAVPDGAFNFTGLPYMARGNGCPTERRFSVVAVNAAWAATAKQNLDYFDQDGGKGTTSSASITNNRSSVPSGNFRTVFDAVGLSRFRRPVGGQPWNCSTDSLAIVDRLHDVIAFGTAGAGITLNCSASGSGAVPPDDGTAGAPRVNTLSVGPNPFNPLVKLNYAVATPGKVTLRIYDVRGALVSTLVDGQKAQGRYQAIWTGVDDSGRKMPSGVFWAKYSVSNHDITRQLVLLK